MGGFGIAGGDGACDAPVLGGSLGASDPGERDPAGLLFEAGDGAEHEGEDTVSGEFAQCAMEGEIGGDGLVGGGGIVEGGQQLEDGGTGRGVGVRGGAAGDGRFDQEPDLGELAEPLGEVGQLPEQRGAHGGVGSVHATDADAVAHLEESLHLEPADGFAERGTTDPEAGGEGPFARQALAAPMEPEEPVADFADQGWSPERVHSGRRSDQLGESLDSEQVIRELRDDGTAGREAGC